MEKQRKLKFVVRLLVGAGKASSAPPLSSTLGNYKVNTSEFCKDFNLKTGFFIEGTPLVVHLFVYDNKSYEYIIKMPPMSFFIKKIFSLDRGSSKSGEEIIGYITPQFIYELVKLKKPEYQSISEHSLFRTLVSNAQSLGIIIK